MAKLISESGDVPLALSFHENQQILIMSNSGTYKKLPQHRKCAPIPL